MNKSSILAAVLLSTAFLFNTANAQSSLVDPGLSTHNYKHPNKAAKAKSEKGEGIVVSNINTVEKYSKQQNNGHVSTTPKYAPRPSTLVVTRMYKKEGVDINPLVSPRNYKTPNYTEKNNATEVASSPTKADTLSYVSVD